MTLPLRIILHLSHLGLTDARTLMRFSVAYRLTALFPSAPHRTGYLNRYVILPRERSYGESSTRTRSPGRTRMKCIRILPDTWARTS